MEIRMASLPVRNEVFRLRSENKDLRGQICDTRTELNKVGKFSRFQKSLNTRLEDEIDNLNGSNDDLELQYQSALPLVIQATEAKRNLATISSQVQELRSTGDKLQEVLRGKSRSCNKPWRTCGNFKIPKSARSTRVPKNLARYKSYNCPRLLVTCGRNLRWNNSGILFGNSPRTTRFSKDPAQHGSSNSPRPLMSQVGKN